MEMPLYQCHKKVHALKISEVQVGLEEGTARKVSCTLVFEKEERFAPLQVGIKYYHMHRPRVGGYYVIYKDGYKSFSPAGAFEDGYTLIK